MISDWDTLGAPVPSWQGPLARILHWGVMVVSLALLTTDIWLVFDFAWATRTLTGAHLAQVELTFIPLYLICLPVALLLLGATIAKIYIDVKGIHQPSPVGAVSALIAICVTGLIAIIPLQIGNLVGTLLEWTFLKGNG